MKRLAFLLVFFLFCSWQLRGQETSYALPLEERIRLEEARVAENTAALLLRQEVAVNKKGLLNSSIENRGSYDVGALPLLDGISSTGARTYSIPLQTAAGYSLVPNLTLSYNSQAGEGIAGYGWDIGGLSAIRLINRNQYYHGEFKAADAADTSAVFSLDGEPLVRNENISQAPFSLTTARTHILVKAEHNPDGFISQFVALYPDGKRAVFGHNLNPGYNLPSYPISEIMDIHGNKISFIYSVDSNNGNDVLQSVRYGYDGAGDYHAEISFTYTSVSSSSYVVRYFAGKSQCINRRLATVESNSDGALLCRYTLTYEQADGASLLTSVGCENAQGGQLPPLVFNYGESSAPQPVSSPSLYQDASLLMTSAFTDIVPVCRRGKFYPGSYKDGLLIYPDGNTYDGTAVLGMYKYGSKYPAAQKILFIPALENISRIDSTITAGSGFQTIDAVDVDGDGRDEIVKVNLAGISNLKSILRITVYECSDAGVPEQRDTFNVKLNGVIINGIFLSPYKYSYQWGDFNGDGKAELLTVAYDKNYNSLHDVSQNCYAALIDIASRSKVCDEELFSYPDSLSRCLFICDLDGDSRSELCFATDSGLDVYRRQASGSFARETTLSSLNAGMLSSKSRPWYLTDLNGDGYPDIVQAPDTSSFSSYWNEYLFNGHDFTTHLESICQRDAEDSFMFMDINRDGLADLVVANGTRLSSHINRNGTSFGSRQISSCHIASTDGILPVQAGGFSGASAFIKVDGFYVRLYGYYPIAPETRNLTSLTDSYGKPFLNTYSYLPDYCHGWYDSELAEELTDGFALHTPPIYVLTDESRFLNEWEGWYDHHTHNYVNGVSHNLGLGFCGFTKVQSAYRTPYPAIYTDRLMAPDKMGVVKKVEIKEVSPSRDPFYTATNTWDSHSTPYGKLSPRLTYTFEEDTLRHVTTTTSYTYDALDFPTLIVTERESTDSYKKETVSRTYSHSDTTALYLLGSVIEESLDRGSGVNPMQIWRNRSEWSLDTLLRPIEKREYRGVATRRIYPPGSHPPGGSPIHYVDGSLLVRTNRWTYDAFGNVSSERSAPYDATEFLGDTLVYDSAGRFLLSRTDALGHTTSYSGYNKFGSPANVTDYRGRVKSFAYDGWGNLLQTNYADGSVETTTRLWGGDGVFKDSTACTGKPATIVHYDALGRVIRKGNQRFDGQWQWVNTEYNARGQVSRTSLRYRTQNPTDASAASLWNTYSYDTYDRLTSIVEASGRTTTWSYNGTSTTTVKDGISSTSTTDAAGNVVSVTDAGGTVTYTLRDDGQSASVTAPGNVVTTFTYDGYGRKVGMVDPSVGTRSYAYTWNTDGSSSSSQTGPNGSITTSKDKYGRTTSVVRAGEFDTTYSYDTYGRLTSEVSTNGTSTTYAYDTLDRVTSVREDVPDGKWLKKDIWYGAGSNASLVQYTSQGGFIAVEFYTYANGHHTKTELQNGTLVFSLTSENNFGQPTAISTQGMSRQYGFNSYGLPTSRNITIAGTTTTVQDCDYSFNAANGNLTAWADNRNATHGSYGYDSLDRLTSGTSSGDNGSVFMGYGYASNGNLTSLSPVGTVLYQDTESPYQATALVPASGGGPVPLPKQAVTYNAYDRPTSISQNGITATLTYNGTEDRVKMAVVDSTGTVPATLLTRYYIGGRYEIDIAPAGSGGGTTTTERFYLGGDAYSAPIVYVKGAGGANYWQAFNIGRDYLGSITQVATDSGTLVAEYSFEPWGRQRNPSTLAIYAAGSEPALFLGRGYTGHEYLPWFGLYNMNARLYDPLVGRFLAPDPFVQAPDFTQNFNRYSYCLNNPLKYSDESGEFFGVDDLIAGAIGGFINWATNGFKFTWEGLSYFGVGFAGGVASLYISPVVASGLMAAANSAIGQGFGDNGKWNGSNINWESVAFSGLTGAATSYLGGVMSSQISGFLSNITDNIAGKAWAGMINKGLTGFATGFTLGTGISLLNQYGSTGKVNMKLAAETGLSSGLTGLALGGISGMAEGIRSAKKNYESPWTGKPRYPNNNGFAGKKMLGTMPEGVYDRYGDSNGHFLAPEGTPFEQRSLPPAMNDSNVYFKYKVVKPIPNVEMGYIKPWFGFPGGGYQYHLPNSVQYYIDNGFIIKL